MKKNIKKIKFNLKDFLINNKKKMLIYGGIFLLIVICILLLIFFVFNNNKYASIKYQVYTSKGFSSSKKDGEIIETTEPIKGLRIISSSKYDGLIYVDISNKNENKRCYTEDECILKENIEKLSFNLTDTLKQKYDIYYRIYSNNKWSIWNSNSSIVEGNEITKIQIKLVPKNSYLEDYLDEYEVINNE